MSMDNVGGMKRHRHAKTVPSCASIGKHGVDIARMTSSMRCVEELGQAKNAVQQHSHCFVMKCRCPQCALHVRTTVMCLNSGQFDAQKRLQGQGNQVF
eukprot:2110046-Amphidinium_carterae.1